VLGDSAPNPAAMQVAALAVFVGLIRSNMRYSCSPGVWIMLRYVAVPIVVGSRRLLPLPMALGALSVAELLTVLSARERAHSGLVVGEDGLLPDERRRAMPELDSITTSSCV